MDTPTPSPDVETTWHIYWQAAKGRDLLVDPSLMERIRERLIETHQLRGRSLPYYLVAPSEIHVLSRTHAGDSPEMIARGVASMVSRWVREIDRSRGPVFAGRYRAHAISTPADLKCELRMLAWRPVALGLCRQPAYYMNSSLRATLGTSRVKDFKALSVLKDFDILFSEARSAMRDIIRGRPSSFEWREWELQHGLALAYGATGVSAEMGREVSGAAASLVAAGGERGIDGAISLLERWISHRLGLPPSQRLAVLPGPQGARARALVGCLAVQWKLCAAASVARRYKRAKATLCEQMMAARARPADQLLLAVPLTEILAESTILDRRAARSRKRS